MRPLPANIFAILHELESRAPGGRYLDKKLATACGIPVRGFTTSFVVALDLAPQEKRWGNAISVNGKGCFRQYAAHFTDPSGKHDGAGYSDYSPILAFCAAALRARFGI